MRTFTCPLRGGVTFNKPQCKEIIEEILNEKSVFIHSENVNKVLLETDVKHFAFWKQRWREKQDGKQY